ncbi:MAG: PGPGW domain-containing protein [Myxococcota bacterium]|nr:hypothetical protein [Deltaproteobacteria bacterium]MDQ3339193.1 PGPGW domain-containing protein [Myxococcota bacterium]
MKQEWRILKHDRPGKRFENHRRRMQKQATWKKVLRGIGGVALIGVGIVFCVLPGPGTLGIVLGLALLGGMSKTIAGWMDRIEPKMRRGLEHLRRFWQALSKPKKALLITVTTIVVAMGVVVVWRGWVGPMVEGYIG